MKKRLGAIMNDPATILVVEDGESERDALVRVLRMEQYRVVSAMNPEHALTHAGEPIDLVISDLRMGKQSGIDLLQLWRQRSPLMPFIIMTAYGDVDSAVTAMKLGAADFLTKPVNPDDLLALVRNCLRAKTSTAPVEADDLNRGQSVFARIIGSSQSMQQVCDQTRRAAQTTSTVLILGESGTGKELIAEAIHQNSPRRDAPFILVNMAAIPETLVESELFGHVRGAFTGASASRVGRFEAANAGTIFIDEIGDFPLGLQAKLLRVLENRTITPVGSNDDKPIDVRVVAATSRNLPRMTATGQFREDLYYRLNVVAVQLPPLRERREDIPLLARHFLAQFARASGRPALHIQPALMEALTGLDWPGNVRQLRNCLESMFVMAAAPILTLEDLPRNLTMQPDLTDRQSMPTGAMLEDVKKTAMLRALKQFGGNRTRAADYLGISVRTLQRKLKEWGPEIGESWIETDQ
jgi:DNA-binding NtrC family response regulator